MIAGSDVAKETGGIILIKNDVRDVVLAIRLSRATMRKIKQNLFWAFIYNSIGIPVAALGFLNPIIAAAAMALSSLSVIVNSALLKRAKLTQGPTWGAHASRGRGRWADRLGLSEIGLGVDFDLLIGDAALRFFDYDPIHTHPAPGDDEFGFAAGAGA